MLLAVGWDDVPDAVKHVPDWTGRIVMDATNQWHQGPGSEVDLGDQTGSERNAALMPGARVVKAFNTIFGSEVAKDLLATPTAAWLSFSPATTPRQSRGWLRSSSPSGLPPSTSAECRRGA